MFIPFLNVCLHNVVRHKSNISKVMLFNIENIFNMCSITVGIGLRFLLHVLILKLYVSSLYKYFHTLFIPELNSNFNFSLSFELSLALLSNFPTIHPPDRVSSEEDQDCIKIKSEVHLHYGKQLLLSCKGVI